MGATIIVVVFVALLIVGSPPYTQSVYPEEIRSYLGESLSSIADMQENEIAGLQNIDQASYRLNITGLVNNPLLLTYEEVINNYPSYQKGVNLLCVEGWDATILWEG